MRNKVIKTTRSNIRRIGWGYYTGRISLSELAHKHEVSFSLMSKWMNSLVNDKNFDMRRANEIKI